jgi:hypothetical protein
VRRGPDAPPEGVAGVNVSGDVTVRQSGTDTQVYSLRQPVECESDDK